MILVLDHVMKDKSRFGLLSVFDASLDKRYSSVIKVYL